MPVDPIVFKQAFNLIAQADQSVESAVAAISQQQKLIEGLAHTDALSELTSVVHSTRALVAKLSAMTDLVVVSHLEVLQSKLPPVERLITNLSKQDGKMPEGRQLLRKAMRDGDLATQATDKGWVNKVNAWLRSLPDDLDVDTYDDLMGLFKMDTVVSPELLDAALKRSSEAELSREEVEGMKTYGSLPAFKRKQILDKYRETEEARVERLKREDMAKGERFLSSEYQSINPLLAAFNNLGIDPKSHRAPDFDYSKIQDALMVEWRRVAMERGTTKEIADSWDSKKLADTYDFVRAMARVWDAYPRPELPGNACARGDIGRFMYAAYPVLDPVKNNYPDGEVNVSATITWPGVMSTTVGDPKQHNFITAKTFIWQFSVDTEHAGRIIGNINPSEQEVTFPVGVTVRISKLIVRRVDKTIRAGDFGQNAEVIAIARLE